MNFPLYLNLLTNYFLLGFPNNISSFSQFLLHLLWFPFTVYSMIFVALGSYLFFFDVYIIYISFNCPFLSLILNIPAILLIFLPFRCFFHFHRYFIYSFWFTSFSYHILCKTFFLQSLSRIFYYSTSCQPSPVSIVLWCMFFLLCSCWCHQYAGKCYTIHSHAYMLNPHAYTCFIINVDWCWFWKDTRSSCIKLQHPDVTAHQPHFSTFLILQNIGEKYMKIYYHFLVRLFLFFLFNQY